MKDKINLEKLKYYLGKLFEIHTQAVNGTEHNHLVLKATPWNRQVHELWLQTKIHVYVLLITYLIEKLIVKSVHINQNICTAVIREWTYLSSLCVL